MISPLDPVASSKFAFVSNISPPSYRDKHTSGILHATKTTKFGNGNNTTHREEHAFAWIQDKDHGNVQNVIGHLEQYGFGRDGMRFVPYSSKEGWVHRYPHACPYMECDADGTIRGVPYYEQCINSNPNIEASQPQPPVQPPKKKKKRGSSAAAARRPKLVPTATLSNAERSQLHIEIFNYFQWLYAETSELETMESGRSTLRRAGITSVPGLQNLLSKLESTFRDVKEYKMNKDADGDEAEGGEATNHTGNAKTSEGAGTANDSEKENDSPAILPLLERRLGIDLSTIVEEQRQRDKAKKEQEEGITKQSALRDYTFEELYDCLVSYKRQHGHVNVVQKHLVPDNDGGLIKLGRWVSELRQRKRRLRAKGLECENDAESLYSSNDMIKLPISQGRLGLTLQFPHEDLGPGNHGAYITAVDEACTFRDQVSVGDRLMKVNDVEVNCVKDLQVGRDDEKRIFTIAKRKNEGLNYYLTAERVTRLDALGFVWVPQSFNKTWDERFELLTQYKEKNGVWPVRREKWEGMGNWVHNQRRAHAQKDKKFMGERFEKMDAIGFPWAETKHEVTYTWDDRIQQLSEFGRVNRHFDVPRSVGGSGSKEDEDALKFFRWVQALHTSYRAYQSGKRGDFHPRLNDERINQLLEMGFEFKSESTRKPSGSKAIVPEIPFDKRMIHLKKVYEEQGNLKIDHRYSKMDNLGGWAAAMSELYKDWQNGNASISPAQESQFHQLIDMEFHFDTVWEARDRRSWQENLDAFLEFQQDTGHANIPLKYKADVRLSTWVTTQRAEYKALMEGRKSNMNQERYDKLENAGFLWDVQTKA